MFRNHNRQDKYGFYVVDNLKFYSKLEAMEFGEKTGKSMRWDFNDVAYSLANWKKEPDESLAELYRQRAQAIRDKYDYVALYYSGGADSNNVLQSFIQNDIRIDEIVSYINYSVTGDKHNFMNGEIFNVAAAKHKEAQLKQPWLKHRIIDNCEHVIDYYNKRESKFDWIYELRSLFNPNNATHQDMKLKIPEWKQMFDSGKKVGFVSGCDKPRVRKNPDGSFYFFFVDLFDNAVSGKMQSTNNPWEFTELFYWDPEFTKIVIKQAHVLKNYIERTPLTDPCITKEKTGLVVISLENDVDHWVTLDKVHSLIYPWWTVTPYQYKAVNLLFTPRDHWFFQMSGNETAKNAWKMGLEKLLELVPEKFKESDGIKIFQSKKYRIG